MATATLTPKPAKTARPRKTAAEWTRAKEMARMTSGYDYTTSPIGKRKDVDVFQTLKELLERDMRSSGGTAEVKESLELVSELIKREAYKRLVATY